MLGRFARTYRADSGQLTRRAPKPRQSLARGTPATLPLSLPGPFTPLSRCHKKGQALKPGLSVVLSPSPALAIPTIQTSSTPIHDHHRLRAALVAHGGARREGDAFAGDFDVFAARGVGGARLGEQVAGRVAAYVRVFF